MFKHPKQPLYKDAKDFASEMQVDDKKNYFIIVEKMKYNRTFYENDAKKTDGYKTLCSNSSRYFRSQTCSITI